MPRGYNRPLYIPPIDEPLGDPPPAHPMADPERKKVFTA